jgi:toxin-antitoxin system PIN domain toxin
MPHLLDTNALIALLDPLHVFHRRTVKWLAPIRDQGWMVCPIVENGAIRIMSNPAYSERRFTPAEVTTAVLALRQVAGFMFVPDTISLADADMFDLSRLVTPAQITDTYLLALAATHGASLATHDRRLVTSAVRHPVARAVLITP